MKGFLRVFAIFYAIGTYLTDLRLPRVVSIYLLIVQFPSITSLFKLSSRFVYEKKKKNRSYGNKNSMMAVLHKMIIKMEQQRL